MDIEIIARICLAIKYRNNKILHKTKNLHNRIFHLFDGLSLKKIYSDSIIKFMKYKYSIDLIKIDNPPRCANKIRGPASYYKTKQEDIIIVLMTGLPYIQLYF